ncbi:MAG TPA: CDGSH iron-sulfur domain-containing protein [Gammaproteobacteria bacterium]|nr:CDGSH iron-sulfur domain-containing protein [Gammaproteobacteria bacterium]
MPHRSNPVVAQKKPCVIELEPGETYYWCACGRSKDQPFCDGSHAGTNMRPVEFSVDEKKKYGLCGCKHTKNPPFCDGSHKDL